MEKGSSSNVNVKITAEAKDTKVTVGSQDAEANKYAYMNNYNGKNPMTRTQWCRFQRKKKLATQKVSAGGNAT
ncbi:hypothetical protein A2U01_0090521, partial [Trifolium medium]|nr:hypothetical protein [Trifolium medium]